MFFFVLLLFLSFGPLFYTTRGIFGLGSLPLNLKICDGFLKFLPLSVVASFYPFIRSTSFEALCCVRALSIYPWDERYESANANSTFLRTTAHSGMISTPCNSQLLPWGALADIKGVRFPCLWALYCNSVIRSNYASFILKEGLRARTQECQVVGWKITYKVGGC